MKQPEIRVVVSQLLHDVITKQAQEERRTVPKSLLVALEHAYGPAMIAEQARVNAEKAACAEFPTD